MDVHVDPESPSKSELAETRQLTRLGLTFGRPVRITIAEEAVPAAGVKITSYFGSPLTEGAGATLVYFDTELQTWRAVPSSLSADRTSVSAIVHHLSVWSFVSGVLSTAAKPPHCDGSTPDWVDTTTFIETDDHNPILFCVGRDPKRPNLLVVKAAVNRGYGFQAEARHPVAWTYNSTFTTQDFSHAFNQAVHLDQNFHDALEELFGGGDFVGPDKEFDFGVDEASVLKGAQPREPIEVLTVKTPSVPQFLVGILGSLVGADLDGKAEGYVAAGLLVSKCLSDFNIAADAAGVTKAILTCIEGLDETAARTLATYLARNPAIAHPGRVAGKVVGRATIFLALLGPVWDAGTYAADARSDPASRTVTVFVKPVTAQTLLTAEVPPDCRLPAQRLADGHTTKGSPGEGWITRQSLVGYGDLARLHYDQALVPYTCTAGGVGWPADLLLVGERGKLLSYAALGKLSHSEHAQPTKITLQGHQATVLWDEYEGAGFQYVHHRAAVTYSIGKLKLEDRVTGYEPDAFMYAVLGAASDHDRTELLDPDAVADGAWRALVAAGTDGVISGECSRRGSRTAVCTNIELAPDYQVQWKATLEKDARNIYGWRLVALAHG